MAFQFGDGFINIITTASYVSTGVLGVATYPGVDNPGMVATDIKSSNAVRKVLGFNYPYKHLNHVLF